MWVLKANPKGLLNKGFVALMLLAAWRLRGLNLTPTQGRSILTQLLSRSLTGRVSQSRCSHPSPPWAARGPSGPGFRSSKKKNDEGGVGAPFDN